MKKNKILSLLLFFIVLLGLFGCTGLMPPSGTNPEPDNKTNVETNGETVPNETKPTEDVPTDGEEQEATDYVAQTKLDMSSDTIKVEVTVKLFVDGDTTHFNISDPSFDGNVLKARYLAVNTPESTGKIEPYGKKASRFTKQTLSQATSIIIETDGDSWEADSTGGRYLVWVWYRTDENSDYRNLNIELLQNGLAIASNSGQNRYGQTCLAALGQSQKLGLNVNSGERDPEHYYGAAVELTLKELRTNIETYNGVKVAFEAIVVKDSAQTVYVEEYDSETDTYYGMNVYYGYNAYAKILEFLAVGNRVRIVGTVSYYDAGGTYQVSGLEYRPMRPNDPGNTQLVSTGHEGAFREISAEDFNHKTITIDQIIENEDGEEVSVKKDFKLPELAISSSISMSNLQVVSVYTTDNEESSSNGAMTLTCKVGNETISVRTIVLKDEGGNIITASAYQGKNINVKGIIDYFNGTYQIKVFSASDITINE